MIEQVGIKEALFVADREHSFQEINDCFYKHLTFDILMPAPEIQKIKSSVTQLDYPSHWAGYALASITFKFGGNPNSLKLFVKLQGEQHNKYNYKSFLTT